MDIIINAPAQRECLNSLQKQPRSLTLKSRTLAELIDLKQIQMPEAIIVILDNSSFAINGDYHPTRWMAQIEAAGLLIQTKMQQSQETAMGIALSGGKQVQIICTPSTDIAKVSSFLYGIKISGHQKMSNALQTAALALKHRLNPILAQRIICFVASTIVENVEELRIICKKLKKNNIALDIIAIGDLSQEQRDKLQAMGDAAKSEASPSELVFVQPDGNISDMLFTSRILGGEMAQPQMINEVDDPELRMALELSLQEEQLRLAAVSAAGQSNNPPQPSEEDELEQRALQLSMQQEKDQEKKEEKKQ